nr:unnamed protein product [Digitaria exilis]
MRLVPETENAPGLTTMNGDGASGVKQAAGIDKTRNFSVGKHVRSCICLPLQPSIPITEASTPPVVQSSWL